MNSLNKKEQEILLKLARSSILSGLAMDSAAFEKPTDVPPRLQEKRGCFVTLNKNGSLRGCIGRIEPTSALISCVEENAINAAFRDPRFEPVTKDEMDAVNIEISILTRPRRIIFKDADDLKKQLIPGVHGVILSQGYRRSTFLPQVWEQLPQTEDFLEHLCIKGSMPGSAWRNPRTCVEVYEVECFSEKQLFS